MSRERVARRRHSSLIAQLTPAFHVQTVPLVL